jgi:hypothetical protein
MFNSMSINANHSVSVIRASESAASKVSGIFTSFTPNGYHNVFVTLDSMTGLVNTVISDKRSDACFDQCLTLEKYNAVIEYLTHNDHIYCINQLNAKYAGSVHAGKSKTVA